MNTKQSTAESKTRIYILRPRGQSEAPDTPPDIRFCETERGSILVTRCGAEGRFFVERVESSVPSRATA